MKNEDGKAPGTVMAEGLIYPKALQNCKFWAWLPSGICSIYNRSQNT
jgi:hypothetical protein